MKSNSEGPALRFLGLKRDAKVQVKPEFEGLVLESFWICKVQPEGLILKGFFCFLDLWDIGSERIEWERSNCKGFKSDSQLLRA